MLTPGSPCLHPFGPEGPLNMLHSIYDLTTFCRKTTGDVPAKLVVCSIVLSACIQIHHFCSQGASTTVIGSKMYLFVSISFLFFVIDYNLAYREGGWSRNARWYRISMCLTWKPFGGKEYLPPRKMMFPDLGTFTARMFVWNTSFHRCCAGLTW